MACFEQDIIRIDKSPCTSSNVANTIMVQQIVRTSSGAANNYRKKYLQLPGTSQKHRLFLKTQESLEISTNKHNSERKNQCPQYSVERWNKKKYRYIFGNWEKFCSERNYNTMQTNADIVLEFLTLEYNKGLFIM